MKTRYIIYSLTTCTLLSLGACSQADETETAAVPAPKVEIRLGSSVTGVESRAAVSAGQSITAQLLGREGGAAGGWKLAAQTWNANATFLTSTTANNVQMASPQYYNNADADKHTYVLGIYPAGTLQGNKVLFSSMNGEQDVMLATWTDAGSKNLHVDNSGAPRPDAPNPAELKFEHTTAQIYFEANLTDDGKGGAFSGPVTLESITLKNACLPTEADPAIPAINFAAPTSLPIPGISSQPLSTTALPCGVPVMVKASGTVEVDIAIRIDGTPRLFNGVVINNVSTGKNLVTETGKRHKVTLTFKAPETPEEGAVELNVSASIKEWEDGNSGSTTLQ